MARPGLTRRCHSVLSFGTSSCSTEQRGCNESDGHRAPSRCASSLTMRGASAMPIGFSYGWPRGIGVACRQSVTLTAAIQIDNSNIGATARATSNKAATG